MAFSGNITQSKAKVNRYYGCNLEMAGAKKSELD